MLFYIKKYKPCLILSRNLCRLNLCITNSIIMTTMTHTAILAASRIPAALNASSTIKIQPQGVIYNTIIPCMGVRNYVNLQLTCNTPTTVQMVNDLLPLG